MMRQLPEKVQQKLSMLPDSPGVYQMLDAAGKVIYVGKAIVLRNRVRSYFHASAQHTPKTLALVEEIRDITWWVTQTSNSPARARTARSCAAAIASFS